MLGLIDAVDKFELEHKVKFETYAVSRIRGEILDYMRSQDWASPSLRKKISAITNAYEIYESQNPGRAVDKDVADSLGMPVDQVRKIQNQTHMFNLVNFEDALGGGGSLEAEIGNYDENTPEDELLEKEKKKILAEVIEELPDKERLLITLYYYEGLLLKEIAEIMRATESRVSQIHSKVLAKMRIKLEKVI
jgi:RNA polymerase sigma factor for flagellar operon FliA